MISPFSPLLVFCVSLCINCNERFITTFKLNASGIRLEILNLQKLHLHEQPGENVTEFNKKVKVIARKLHLAGTVSDLNTLVASRYIHCTVEAFRLEALRLFNEYNNNGFTPQDSKFWMKIMKSFVLILF